jgi:phage repressor protein C with HTH and peptisase S24 domain
MAHFGETIRRLREERFHWSQAELAERIGSDRQHVSRIEAKLLATIRQETYRKLAEAFGMSVEQLDYEWRGTKLPQTQGAPGLIPVINRAPAGVVVNYDETGVDSGQGKFYIERGGVNDPNAFAVIVVGDSMEGELTEGDYAIFSPMRMDGALINMPHLKIEEGHTVFVRFSQDSRHEGCTLAMLYRLSDGRIELRKRNNKYRPIVVRPEEIAGMSALNQVRQNKIPGGTPEFEAFDPSSRRYDDAG